MVEMWSVSRLEHDWYGQVDPISQLPVVVRQTNWEYFHQHSLLQVRGLIIIERLENRD